VEGKILVLIVTCPSSSSNSSYEILQLDITVDFSYWETAIVLGSIMHYACSVYYILFKSFLCAVIGDHCAINLCLVAVDVLSSEVGRMLNAVPYCGMRQVSVRCLCSILSLCSFSLLWSSAEWQAYDKLLPSASDFCISFQSDLRGCQTNNKVGRLLWLWFSCPTKSAYKIGEPWHTAYIFICYFVRYQLAQQPNADRKMRHFFCI